MNRCKISLGVLAALVVLCVTSLLVLRVQCREFTSQVETVAAAVQEGDTQGALTAYDELREMWEEFHDVTGLFVGGEKLEPLREILMGLRSLIAQNHPELTSELDRLHALAQEIFEAELPMVWRIL